MVKIMKTQPKAQNKKGTKTILKRKEARKFEKKLGNLIIWVKDCRAYLTGAVILTTVSRN